MTALDRLVGGPVAAGVPLGPLTTYKFGGPARHLATVESAADLDAVLDAGRSDAAPVLVLGRGSNVVVSDRGWDGVVVRLDGEFLEVRVEGSTVEAGGAAPLPQVARRSVRAGRGGLEFYVGIPGSVGGAVRMNAGCHGSETRDVLVTASVIDMRTGDRSERTPGDLGLSYRHSDLTDADLVVGAAYRTVPRDRAEGERLLRDVTRWRREHQPGGTFNAGSVFKNPPGDAAGRLIDAAGLKGFAVGGASVSVKHANFFVAGEGATAQDVYDLVWAVRRRIIDDTGIELEPEIRFAGAFDDSPDQPDRPRNVIADRPVDR